MYWGSSATSVLFGIVGGVVIVCAVLLGRRLGARRAVGTAGLGLLLLGLSLSGLVEAVARVLAIFSFNPLRWAGLAAAVLGAVLLSWAGMVPGRRRKQTAATEQSGTAKQTRGSSRRAAIEGDSEAKSEARSGRRSQGGAPAVGDSELDEIEEILRRRGIS